MKPPLRQISFLVLLLAPLALTAQEAGLFYSRGIPQVEFAATEICATLQAKGNICAVSDLARFLQATQSVRIVLISSSAGQNHLACRIQTL